MKQEELKIIKDALLSASALLSDEIECVDYEPLYEEYQSVIDKLDSALELFDKEITIR